MFQMVSVYICSLTLGKSDGIGVENIGFEGRLPAFISQFYHVITM